MKLWTIFAFMTLFISGCKSRDFNSDVERVEYVDRGKPGETLTDSRISSLNDYADKLLAATSDETDLQRDADAYFARKGVTNYPKLKDVFKVYLQPRTECFQEEWNSLSKPSYLAALKKQVESVGEFALKLYKILDGRTSALGFREIAICPRAVTKSRLKLSGGILTIGLGNDWTGTEYSPMTSDTLKLQWDRGFHFLDQIGWGSSTYNYAAALWVIFNPVGDLSIKIRETFKKTASATIAKIKEIRSSLPSKNEIEKSRPNFLEKFKSLAATERLSAISQKSLNTLPGEKFELLLNNWACILAKGNVQYNLSDESLAQASDLIRQENNDIDIELNGGVVVGNYHRIGVTALLMFNSTNMKQYLKQPPPRSSKIKVKANGGVVVFTIDDITVDVASFSSFAAETASLDAALLAAVGGKSSPCK